MTAAQGPSLGTVVAKGLDLRWQVHADPFELGLDALVGLAVRRNPKRAQLVVSRVLAKHIPARPAAVRAAGLLLASLVQQALTGHTTADLDGGLLTDPDRGADVDARAIGAFEGAPLVIGFCETATALGHLVADAFTGGDYLHTTRRPDPLRPVAAGFDEEHSHAVSHVLQPDGPLLDDGRPLVLVDDELTTGTTALNTLAALHARSPRPAYVIAALLDLRPEAARRAFRSRAAALGVPVTVVALLDGVLEVPVDALSRAAGLLAATNAVDPADQQPPTTTVTPWPPGVPTGGRHGFLATDRPAFTQAVDTAVSALNLTGLGPVLVVGTEELIYAPVRVAHALELALRRTGRARQVLVQSTTRSPVVALDVPGYAIRRRLVTTSPDDPSRPSFLYNLKPGYDDIVVVTEDPVDRSAGLLTALRPWARSGVHLLVLDSLDVEPR